MERKQTREIAMVLVYNNSSNWLLHVNICLDPWKHG